MSLCQYFDLTLLNQENNTLLVLPFRINYVNMIEIYDAYHDLFELSNIIKEDMIME